jgi:hypothetical protein
VLRGRCAIPRNSSGVFTLAKGAFSPNTPIVSGDVNADLADIATGLTQSLSINGVTLMIGQLPAATGSAAAPGYAFGSDLKTGFWLSGTHQIQFVYNGTAGLQLNGDGSATLGTGGWTCGGVTCGAITASGALSGTSGSFSTTLGVTGAATFSSTASIAGKLSLTSTDSMAMANGTTGQRNGSPSAGDTRYNSTLNIIEYWNGTVWSPAVAYAMPGSTLVTIKNNSGTPNTKADITVSGLAILVNSSGYAQYVTAPGTVTCNFATTGANGMDTGGLSASAPVYIYGIYNPSTATWATVGSLTAPPTGPSLPSGYTFQVHLGEMMVDGSTHLRSTIQTGKRVSITASPPSIGTGTITYSTFYPATSEAGMLIGDVATVSNNTWSVSDMNGTSIFVVGALPAGSGEHVLNLVTVQNTGGTTFTTAGTGATINAYGWITRANVT